MTIALRCDHCLLEMSEFGGLLFGPPNEAGMVRKHHLCVTCYTTIVALLELDGQLPPFGERSMGGPVSDSEPPCSCGLLACTSCYPAHDDPSTWRRDR